MILPKRWPRHKHLTSIYSNLWSPSSTTHGFISRGLWCMSSALPSAHSCLLIPSHELFFTAYPQIFYLRASQEPHCVACSALKPCWPLPTYCLWKQLYFTDRCHYSHIRDKKNETQISYETDVRARVQTETMWIQVGTLSTTSAHVSLQKLLQNHSQIHLS